MADVFNWIRPGYELVTAKLEWNVQVLFLQTKDGKGETLESPVFSSKKNPNSKWQLQVEDDDETQIIIYACHCDSETCQFRRTDSSENVDPRQKWTQGFTANASIY